MAKKKGANHIFWQEMKRDWKTFLSLDWKRRTVFIFDYYRWYIVGLIAIIIVMCTTVSIIWQGSRPCRLRATVVLNTEASPRVFFEDFEKKLKADGKEGAVDINCDQPFDYDNMYYYVQELEVLTTISSRRMDVAICNEDMYTYLLAINACMDLAQLYPEENLVHSVAGVQIEKDGSENRDQAVEGEFALDLTGTPFSANYNKGEDGEEAPLYAVIISNTGHLEDALRLVDALLE